MDNDGWDEVHVMVVAEAVAVGAIILIIVLVALLWGGS
jgi:hypothetical protein